MPEQFDKHNICAVIVTFNPDDKLERNINALTSQVDKILLVDNGSSDKKVIESFQSESIEVKLLDKNYGIGKALNEGIKYCCNRKYKLMLSMDQDTILFPDAVSELLEVINDGYSSAGINWDKRANNNQRVGYLITSGNLVNVEALKEIGGYNEELFIDSVDFDVSLRLRDHGYKLIKVAKALAEHHIGEDDGTTEGVYRHSVNRYFYISRNHYYILNKYWKRHPFFCLKKQMTFLREIWLIKKLDPEKEEKINQIRLGREANNKEI